MAKLTLYKNHTIDLDGTPVNLKIRPPKSDVLFQYRKALSFSDENEGVAMDAMIQILAHSVISCDLELELDEDQTLSFGGSVDDKLNFLSHLPIDAVVNIFTLVFPSPTEEDEGK